jgi:hypothetical protein
MDNNDILSRYYNGRQGGGFKLERVSVGEDLSDGFKSFYLILITTIKVAIKNFLKYERSHN